MDSQRVSSSRRQIGCQSTRSRRATAPGRGDGEAGPGASETFADGGSKRPGREELAGADGRRGGEVGMRLDAGRLDGVTRAEVSDEGLGRGHLAGRGGFLVQVSHEADADAVLVDLRVLGVPAVDAVLLVDPPLGDLDLAVVRARAVADHEVIAAAVVAQDLAVLGVDLVVVARGIRAVVEDDVLPGAVGLVGIEELVAARLAQVGPQPLLRAGPADLAGGRGRADVIGGVPGRSGRARARPLEGRLAARGGRG